MSIEDYFSGIENARASSADTMMKRIARLHAYASARPGVACDVATEALDVIEDLQIRLAAAEASHRAIVSEDATEALINLKIENVYLRRAITSAIEAVELLTDQISDNAKRAGIRL